ncbi:MAG: class I SAM-dependent methyltransferase [Rhodanobacter sp.]|nr:MAG: class I SAM-dependent methyltransferase [Rhodanobacter sp.]TAL96465.1 MAG: class I SAM-dependent methyltransferase [Rhodanobacter sp.]TAM41379.1 MAG: class I SAM-dependent methyltransferase [Rhodanobacter sp.]TAN26517.1 MAG: class I SAM-dependent methyltransferase [Rhodanobacter sp.]
MTKPTDKFDVIRDFYDNEYYANVGGRASLPWHSRRVSRRLGDMAQRQVLDVACGTGEWLGLFHDQGATVAGIDLSRKAIDECQRRFPEGEFHCGPAEVLPFADARFDLVTCMGSLEHFLDKPGALSEMHRVAKPDASFLILVPNAGFLTRRLGLYGGTQQVKAKEDVLELDRWNELLQQSGLVVLDRWRDLHPISWHWITHGNPLTWPVRAAQALALATWPVKWQYQVYHYCKAAHE